MTNKGKVLQWLWYVGAGTVAGIIGCTKYSVIDRVINKAAEKVSNMTEDECREIVEREMAGYADLLVSCK